MEATVPTNSVFPKISVQDFLVLFNNFNWKEQSEIVEKIGEMTFEKRWAGMDPKSPEVRKLKLKRYNELTSKFKVSEEAVEDLVKSVKKNWRKKRTALKLAQETVTN